jgi:hypothetical protein
MLASAAILVAFFIAWFAGVILSFRHAVGVTGRVRVRQFFEPGSYEWSVAILVALILLEAGRRLDPIPPTSATTAKSSAAARRSHFAHLLPLGLLLAAASIVLSAVVGILVELTDFGNGIDAAFSLLINYVAILGLGGAATWLAVVESSKSSGPPS